MTTEEKAKAYEEALERAKKYNVDDAYQGTIVKLIFPELRESEDERIRKAIIKSIEEDSSVYEQEVSKEQMIAYLEKQKEPHYTKRNALFDKCVENCDPAVMKKVSDEVDEMLEKEQKSNFVPKVIRPKFAVGDTIYRPMWSDHTIREIYIDCNDPVYVCVNEEGTESHISFSEQDEWERKEQKPVEWSDNFEENIRTLLHDKLTWHSEDGRMSSTVFIDDKTLKDIISGIWFYVGKEALKYPNKELNVTGWSEEDERKYQCIRSILLTDMDKKVGSWKYSEILEWYEKRGINRYTNSEFLGNQLMSRWKH